MIELTDTHCHIQSIGTTSGEDVTRELWFKAKNINQDEVVEAAKQNGVTRLMAVGCNLSDSKLAIESASKYPNVWATIGIHPHEAKDYASDVELKKSFADLVTASKVVAVGECGLDYYYSHSSPKDQKAVLEFQLDLATASNLPLVFHVREAFDDFWPILANFKNVRGVVHSFTDTRANLSEALKRGLYVGVNGIATFTKDPDQTEVYRSIPLNNLVLETDAPFLTPTPLRGTINEPKNVRFVAEYLANLRGQSLEQIASQTTLNANNLFVLKS